MKVHGHLKTAVPATVVLAATFGLAAVAQAVDGFPDKKSFGGDGVVTTPVSPLDGQDRIEAIARQPDGKIVAVGSADNDSTATTDSDFMVVRYNPNGTLDDTSDGDSGFGSDGIVTTAIGSGAATDEDKATDVAIQPDGKIVVAGFTEDANGDRDFALVRYNADGTLDDDSDDPGFGTDGIVVTPAAPENGAGEDDDGAFGVAIQSDGKIVATGFAEFAGSADLDLAVVRYNDDGTLDAGFDGDPSNPGGGDGIVGTDVTGTGNFEEAQAVAIQADGKIVVAGEANGGADDDFVVARYSGADGTLDASFDGPGGAGNGKFLLSFGSSDDDANDLAIQAGGKIVVAGTARLSPDRFAVARLLPATGDLDSSFDGNPGDPAGGNGKVTTSVDGNSAEGEGIAVAPDGKLVLVGRSLNTFAAARYKGADGALDTSFAGDGTLTTPIPGAVGVAQANGALVQPDGKVVAGGSVFKATTVEDAALVRWGAAPSNPGSPPPSGSGTATTPAPGERPRRRPRRTAPACKRLRKKLKKAKAKSKRSKSSQRQVRKLRKKLRKLGC